ncbi:unnamed protein product [Lathyrus oleraceus]
MYKPTMFVVTTTRCQPNRLHSSLQKLGFDKVISSSNMGYAGGIIVTWRKHRMNITLSSKEEQSTHLRIRILTGEKWMFTFIYASPNVDMRSRLWDNLKNRARNIRSPWFLDGYFNETAYANENKFGVQASHRKCMAFQNNIEECKFHDLGASGPKFTWRGLVFHGGQRIYER